MILGSNLNVRKTSNVKNGSTINFIALANAVFNCIAKRTKIAPGKVTVLTNFVSRPSNAKETKIVDKMDSFVKMDFVHPITKSLNVGETVIVQK